MPNQKKNLISFLFWPMTNVTIHALGNQEVITSNLYKLVEQGETFTHAYNMGAWSMAVCVPSRTMFQTGKMLWNAYEADAKMRKKAYILHLCGGSL